MMKVRLRRNAQGHLHRFEGRGHALFAEEGADIVCAGASALLQAALLGLDRVVQAAPRVTVRKGHLSCSVKPSRETDVVLETMLLGLREIEQQYPGYIRIEEITGGSTK
jgi:uncharacterized protein YsxB (DUF464 family)